MTTAIAGLAALAALVTALVGVYQVRLLRRQVADAERPYVVADIVPGLHGAGSWDLTLHSTGRSAARRVRIMTEPSSWEPRNSSDHITARLLEYLDRQRDLPPDARQRVMWSYSRSDDQEAGGPAVATVTVKYEGDDAKPYSESFAFDTDALAAVSPVPTEGPRVGSSEKGHELRNIDRAIRTLAQHVGELRR